MSYIPLVYAPNDIFRKKAQNVELVDDSIRSLVDSMFATLYLARGVGLAGNMVGVLKRVAVVDLQENSVRKPLVFINPEITWRSGQKQSFNEGSLSFPGIEAVITRPDAIKIKFLDYEGNAQQMGAEGFLATVIQHEVDYLDGKVFLDYLSKMKSDMLIKKMQKYIRMYPPHIHSEHCHH
jgi:peptide deformylase